MAADPLTTLDLIAVGAVIVALAGAVAALWLAFKSRTDRMEEAQKDLVERVRGLEEARLVEVKEYAAKTEATNNRVLTVFDRVVDVLQDLASAVAEGNKRPCIAEALDSHGKKLHPTPIPDVETDVLLRNDERVKRHHQEESAGP